MSWLVQKYEKTAKFYDYLIPIGDLIIRLYVAKVFFLSGLAKIQNWEGTVALFENEYKVPYLLPDAAAAISIIVELVFPILLALGLGGRWPAFILFVFNIFAAAFYPFLWTHEGSVGLENHIVWGLLLLAVWLHGSGKLSLDYLIHRKRERKVHHV
jgi:putative oxidoreductase